MTKLEQFQNLIWKARRRHDQQEVDHLNEIWDEATEKARVLWKDSPEPFSYEDIAEIALRMVSK